VDDLEDYLELQDHILRKHIKESYAAYERGEFKDADTFLAELRSEVSESKKKKTKKL
jgi:hypothetical protein